MYHARSWRAALAIALAVAPAVAVLPAQAVPAAPDTGSTRTAAKTPGFTGEADEAETGPRTAPVDPDFATPKAARIKVKKLRGDKTKHAAHTAAAGSTTGTATSATSATATVVRTAAATSTATTTTASTTAPTTTSTTTPTPDVTLDPARYGDWETLTYSLPVRAVHATLLHTGELLLIAGSGNVSSENVVGNFKAYLWNPTTAALTSVPVPYDGFCSGHLVDADGNVVVMGGTTKYKTSSNGWIGSAKAYKFVVATRSWVEMKPMAKGRWYPTPVINGKGQIFTYSGRDVTGSITTTPERFDPATGSWTRIAGREFPLYPGLFLLKDGRLAYTGAHYGTSTIAPKTFDPISGVKGAVGDPAAVMDLGRRNAAMSALVGSADQQLAWVAGGGFPAVKSTYFTDYNAAAPAAVAGPPLSTAKAYVSISHLPDLSAVETGGGTGTDSPVFETSILDPHTRTLTPMAPHDVPRTYHSSSLTLPDGRVVTLGGDPAGDSTFEMRVEVYSPPYLFKGPRPEVTSAPAEMAYGGTYPLGASATGTSLAYASLLRPGSATHSLDANQRVLRLATTAVAGGVQVVLPTNRDLLPPGKYLLSVVDAQGRPSVSRWVHLR